MALFNKYLSWFILSFTILLCGIFAFLYWKQFHEYSKSNSPSDWGVFGDYIGGTIGSILTFGTTIFIILTLQSQNKTKNDNFFFYLLQLHEKHTTRIRGSIGNEFFEGKVYYRKLLEECCILYHIHSQDAVKVSTTMTETKNLFSSYVSNLNEIVKFINHSGKYFFSNQSKNFKNLLIAQLSNDEKILLGYMCAFKIIDESQEFYQFYIQEKLKERIDYETHLNASKYKKPDAIEAILNQLPCA